METILKIPPPGDCVCPKCGTRAQHNAGKPCNTLKCPKCGTPMVRQAPAQAPAEEQAVQKQRVPPDDASNEAKRKAQRERSRRFGIEALQGKGENLSFPKGFPTQLADYGDPVNLKYPLAPDSRARAARAYFKRFASEYKRVSSRRVVHTRIVERLLAIGAKPSFKENDPLDKLLPPDLVRRMKEAKLAAARKAAAAELAGDLLELLL